MAKIQYYTIKQIAETFDRDPHTIRDWINHGCPTPDGRVKLMATKLGKSWSVKDEWFAAFELRVRPDQGRPDLQLEKPDTEKS